MNSIAASAALDRLERRGIPASPIEAEQALDAATRTVATFRALADRLGVGAAPEAFSSQLNSFRSRAATSAAGLISVEEPSPAPTDADIDAIIERAEEAQRQFNAFIEITAESAYADAQRHRSAPSPRGSLSGHCFAHKDVFVTTDRLPSVGVGEGHRWRGPMSTTLAALKRAGAVTVGATNLDPWCYVPLGLNDYFGRVRHPLGRELLTGGSSSGSAVAVASGVVGFALGTDTGGSIRLPAALCGIYGLKTTQGLIRDPGMAPLSASQDCLGILGSCPEIIEAALHVVAPGLSMLTGAGRGELSVGVDAADDGKLDPAIAGALDATLARFREIGATVKDVTLPELDAVNAAAAIITGFEAASIHAGRLVVHPEWYPAAIRQRLLIGLLYDEADYREATRIRAAYLREVLCGAISAVEVILAPVLAVVGPCVADASPHLVGSFLRFNRPANFLGVPALAVPVGHGSDGLPVGMQLIGRPFADAALLEIAAALRGS